MKKRKDGGFSLKWGLSIAVVLCWVVPILVVVTVSGILLNLNYENHIRQELTAGTEHAMEQVKLRFSSALEASKAASYEGIIEQAYEQYQTTGNKAQLYKTMSAYLSKAYSREASFNAVFVTFLDHPDSDYFYAVDKQINSYGLLKQYRGEAKQQLLELAGQMDTGIRFCEIGGELYMVRNLLDSSFEPYAVLAMQCSHTLFFQPLEGITSLTEAEIWIDDTCLPLLISDGSGPSRWDKALQTEYKVVVGGIFLKFLV